MTDKIKIYNLNSHTVRVEVIDGYEAAIWVGPTGADIFISALDGSESFRVRLQGPKPGEAITVIRDDGGAYEVAYRDIGDMT